MVLLASVALGLGACVDLTQPQLLACASNCGDASTDGRAASSPDASDDPLEQIDRSSSSTDVPTLSQSDAADPADTTSSQHLDSSVAAHADVATMVDVPSADSRPPMDPLKDGLVAHWPFDEGTGLKAADRSGNNNHGTLTAGVTWVNGAIGKAISYDTSDDEVTTTAVRATNLTGAVTISAWYNSSTSPTEFASLVSRNVGVNVRGYLLRNVRGENFEFLVSPDCTAEVNVQDTTIPPTGRWVHVVGVFDPGRALNLYIDGALVAQRLITFTKQCSNDFPVGIGNRPPGANGGDVFRGYLDDIRIYERALPASDVLALFRLKAA
jgi:hypothetical protein